MKRAGPRRNRGTTARTGMVHVTGGFSSPSPGVPGLPRTLVGEGGAVSKRRRYTAGFVGGKEEVAAGS